MPAVAPVRGRPITLSREGQVFRLAFAYNPALVKRAQGLPYATFDGGSRSWTTEVCAQSVQQLRRMWHEGLIDVGPDDLLHPGETPRNAADAVLRAGTAKRPYYVHLATRDSDIFPALRALPGALWEKKAKALSYPPAAAPALSDLVDRGTLDDPDKLLQVAAVTVAFDARTGLFAVRGDGRAAAVFHASFPARDVVGTWLDRGLDAAFLDSWTEQMYRGELARVGEGFQPAGMKLDLLPYQRQAVAILLERDGLAVLDEPGLGKTSQGIGAGWELVNRGAVSRNVIVVPSSVRTQWANEIVKFTGEDASRIVVIDGDRTARARGYESGLDARWVIVHYDVLARDSDDIKPLFNGAFVVADEAHRIKNHEASRTKALKALSRASAKRLALTGTPVVTSPTEWFEVLSWAVPGCLGSPFEFNERYRWKARFGGYEGSRNLGELRERSRPFYVRRTKAQVADHLPPLQVSTLTLDPSPAYAGMLRRAHADAAQEIRQARLVKTLGKRAADAAADGDFTLVDKALVEEAAAGADMTAVSQLRLLCSSPRLINAESDSGRALIEAGLVVDEDGPRVEEVRTLAAELLSAQQVRHDQMDAAGRDRSSATVEEVTGERVVLFTFSKRMADLLAERLTEDGVPYVLFTGDTSRADRDAAVAAFTDPTSDVIVFLATDAAAEGLNLGTCCARLVNVDLPWTPATLAQRSQRIHRLDGKAARYQVTNLTLAGTMEHGVLKLLEARTDLADALFGEQGGRQATVGKKARSGGPSLAEQALTEYAATHPAPRRRTTRPKDDAVGQVAPAGAGAAGEVGPDSSTQLRLL